MGASTGVIKVGLMIDFGNFTIADSDQGITLTITPSFDLLGQIVSWNLDDMTISNCAERSSVKGLLLSNWYCGYLKRKSKEVIESGMKKAQYVGLPVFIQKVKQKLQMKAGKTITIHLSDGLFLTVETYFHGRSANISLEALSNS